MLPVSIRSQNLEGSYRFRDGNYFPSLKLETKKNILSLFRDGKVSGLYFRSQNLEGTYRAIFRDENLETKIFLCLNRDGNNFPSLNRDGNCFPSLFRDGNVFPCLNRDGKISVSKFPSLFFYFLKTCFNVVIA